MSRIGSGFPKRSKMTIIFELSKVSEMISLKIYISCHGEARIIKFGQQVNLIQKVALGTLLQELMTPLPHVTSINLFISNYGSKSNSFLEVYRALVHGGSNVITFL